MAEKEYIEREAALRANCYFCSAHLKDDSPCDEKCADYMKFMEIPASDVRPVVRGKWIDMGDFISCSSCNATRLKEFESDYGKVMRLDVRTNFCPNCGAKMEG